MTGEENGAFDYDRQLPALGYEKRDEKWYKREGAIAADSYLYPGKTSPESGAVVAVGRSWFLPDPEDMVDDGGGVFLRTGGGYYRKERFLQGVGPEASASSDTVNSEEAWMGKCVSKWTPDDGHQWLSETSGLAPHWETLGRPTGKALAKMKRKKMEQTLGADIGGQVFEEVDVLLRERKEQLGQKFTRYTKKRDDAERTSKRLRLERHVERIPHRPTRPPPAEDGNFMPGQYKYVDKSDLITELLMSETRFFFVTGPRRMGKSTMLSMAHSLALGRWGDFSDGVQHWDPDPSDVAVIHLNFSHFWCPASNIEKAETKFQAFIISKAKSQHGLSLAPESEGCHPLLSWVAALRERKKRVVLLVDEYDSFVNDAALNEKVHFAEELCECLLKPFFKATKDADDADPWSKGRGLVKVIVSGVSGVSLKSLASGANHFNHAFETDPRWSALIGFTEEELRRTYSDQLVEALQSLPNVGGDKGVDAAVDFVRSIDNGWCLDTHGSVLLFSPFVVTSWLSHPKSAPEATTWTETGSPRALIELLRSRAPELLEDRVVTVADLTGGRGVREYYSPQNIAQLAFHYGYMTVKAGSHRVSSGGVGPTVVLTVPNDAVRKDIESSVRVTASVNNRIAGRLEDALRAFDFNAFESGLNELAVDFCRAHGRPFENESELHSWGALWVTAVQRLTASSLSLWTIPEVSVALNSDPVTRLGRETSRIDSTFYWVNEAGENCCAVIEWGIGTVENVKARTNTRAVDTLGKKKLEQIKDRKYVNRARDWMKQQGKPVAPRCFKAAAAVYCWNKSDVDKGGENRIQHQCKVFELRCLN